MFPRLPLLVASVALLATAQPKVSSACGMCGCETPYGIRPVTDSIETVPLNARFLVALDGEDPITVENFKWLNTDTDEPVTFDAIETAGAAEQVWLVPRELLLPDTHYVIQAAFEDGETIFSERFVTNSDIDTSEPSVGATQVELEFPSASCGPFYGARLKWNAIHDNGARVTYDPLVELLVEQGAESVVLFDDARNTDRGKGVWLAAPLDEGSTDCWRSSGLPFGNTGKALTVTATVYDRAGNHITLAPIEVSLARQEAASCPSAEGEIEEGESAMGGCGFAQRSRGFSWALLVIALCAAVIAGRRSLNRP